ncbi:MAG TPA: hypothetical protein PL112_14870 [Candidatus Obscuribacter sp.]|nr:hypothetical protein [Candidatus Obscuribacter sp.]
MRWLLADTGNDFERRRKEQKQEQIERFWQRFAQEEKALARAARIGNDAYLSSWLGENLLSLSEDILWELENISAAVSMQKSPMTESYTKLVITSGGRARARLLVNHIVAAAPNLPSWQFAAYKEPNQFGQYQDSRLKGDWSKAEVTIEVTDTNALDLTILSERFHKDGSKEDLALAMVLAESLLGEEILDKWINIVVPRSRQERKSPLAAVRLGIEQRQTVNIKDLFQAVTDTINQIKEALPPQPLWQYQCSKRELEHHGRKPEDWEADQGADVNYSTLTNMPKLSRAPSRRYNFYSTAFSRHNELFCYLKIKGADELRENQERRLALARAVDACLHEGQVGCLTGSGITEESVILELMLHNLKPAVELLRRVAAQTGLPATSWLLFHDRDYQDEWAGLKEDSPLP